MANLGSAFLGDSSRRRFLSTSTPPSSPPFPPSSGGRMATSSTSVSPPVSPPPPPPTLGFPVVKRTIMLPPPPPAVIDPELSLELRLRWLEALLMGIKSEKSSGVVGTTVKTKAGTAAAAAAAAAGELKSGSTVIRTVEDIQTRLNLSVQNNDGLKRFMDQYDQYAHLLTPAFALSGLLEEAPAYEDMTLNELDAFLAEIEPEVRAADRDLKEIEALELKGVLEAGKLTEHEKLQPRLTALIEAQEEDLKIAAGLERRIARLMEGHAVQVDALSELFVDWDEILTISEDKLAAREREHVQRQRLGLDSE